MNYDLGMLKKKKKCFWKQRSSRVPPPRPGGGGTCDKFVRETRERTLGTRLYEKRKNLRPPKNSDPPRVLKTTQTPRVFQNLRAPKNSVRDFMALNNLCLFSCQQLRKYRNLESLCTRNGMKYLQYFADACCVMLVTVQWPDLVWNITAHTAIKTSCDSDGMTKN